MHAQPPFRVRLLAPILRRTRPAWLAAWAKRLLRVPRYRVDVADGSFAVDPISHLGEQLLTHGCYEPDLAATLEHYLRPGHTFIDIGANEGYFTVIAGRLVGPTGRVLAIEPQSRLQSVIKTNVRINGLTNCMCWQAAVGAHDGTADLYLSPSTNTGASGFVRPTRYQVATEPVRVVTLATLLEGFDRVDLVKMDIEGWEHEALAAAGDVLASGRIRAIALELHQAAIAARGFDPAQVPQALLVAGYELDRHHSAPADVAHLGRLPVYERLVYRRREAS